ncbi:Hypothetical predicted protein [Podarcis lilfordi]|uniref:Uncharacterized protein n=1 Tax=Podarcis lilfordi TaxID=74358 RepID=A0AA35L5H9_9SAUR|nr:Hypothetical predicted protein [Podarcis lilfordi]
MLSHFDEYLEGAAGNRFDFLPYQQKVFCITLGLQHGHTVTNQRPMKNRTKKGRCKGDSGFMKPFPFKFHPFSLSEAHLSFHCVLLHLGVCECECHCHGIIQLLCEQQLCHNFYFLKKVLNFFPPQMRKL